MSPTSSPVLCSSTRHMTSPVLLQRLTPGVILSRDQYLASAKINSMKKVPYSGFKPSFYPRTVTELDTTDPHVRNSYIQELLERDRNFPRELDKHTSKIQKFLGPDFPLSFPELLCIICGLSKMSIDLPNTDPTHKGPGYQMFSKIPKKPEALSMYSQMSNKVQIQHDQLRLLGERFFMLHSTRSVVFLNLKHLLDSQDELEQLLSYLENPRGLIVSFMRLNNLFDCLIPCRGPASGEKLPYERSLELRKRLRQETSVASFFTMLGVVTARHGTEKVLRKLWEPRIIGSNTGLLKLITVRLTRR